MFSMFLCKKNTATAPTATASSPVVPAPAPAPDPVPTAVDDIVMELNKGNRQNVKKLTGRDLITLLRSLPYWSGILKTRSYMYREFVFSDNNSALEFVNRVCEKADSLRHYPKITILRNRVLVNLRTAEVDGISWKDIEFALILDESTLL